MREILFRGKRLDNCTWAEGSLSMEYFHECGCVMISPTSDTCYKVEPETVGQFTGRTDKNGKKVFEHDVIRHHFGDEIGVIRFGQYRNPFGDDEFGGHVGFYVDWIAGTYPQTLRKDLGYWMQMVEVIGNIHDNPELLEVGENGN